MIEQTRFRGAAVAVFALTTVALIFDGFDVQAIAFVAPAVLQEWGLSRAALAPVLSMGLIGMASGALLLSGLGDRYGRRPTLIIATAIVALGAFACGQSNSKAELIIWRFFTGIGLGVSAPNAIALMVEFTPRRVRNLLVSITLVGVPIGGMIGAEVAARLVPTFGWHSVFYVGAIFPAAIAVLMWFGLRESPRFLEHSDATSSPPSDSGKGRILSSAIGSLLSPQHRRDTLILWLIFFTNLFSVYVLFGWLPTALSSVGLSLGIALRCSLLFNLGGVAGALLGAKSMDRWGSKPVLITFALFAIAAFGALTWILWSADLRNSSIVFNVALLSVMTFAGLTVLGLQVAMYSVAAHAYPTSLRAGGVGWAQGIARLGGVLSSYAGSGLLALGHGLTPFFLGLAMMLSITLSGLLLLKRHLPATARSAAMV
ncbi:MAG TPA: MFS transporter [Steroidobacteraceae bacterium]